MVSSAKITKIGIRYAREMQECGEVTIKIYFNDNRQPLNLLTPTLDAAHEKLLRQQPLSVMSAINHVTVTNRYGQFRIDGEMLKIFGTTSPPLYATIVRDTITISSGIRTRWQSRVIPNGWRRAEGAASYLQRYGRNIGLRKVQELAKYAEEQDDEIMARSFWSRALEMHKKLIWFTAIYNMEEYSQSDAIPDAIPDAEPVAEPVQSHIPQRPQRKKPAWMTTSLTRK